MAKVKSEEALGAAANGRRVGLRTTAQIIQAWIHQGDKLELNEAEIKLLIDTGAEIEERRRAIDKEVKATVEPAKEIIKHFAKKGKWKHKEGNTGKVDITASTKTITGTVIELAKLLKKEGKEKLLNLMTSIRITEAKKFLGEDVLFKSGIFTSDREEYGSVSLKKK